MVRPHLLYLPAPAMYFCLTVFFPLPIFLPVARSQVSLFHRAGFPFSTVVYICLGELFRPSIGRLPRMNSLSRVRPVPSSPLRKSRETLTVFLFLEELLDCSPPPPFFRSPCFNLLLFVGCSTLRFKSVFLVLWP